MSALENMTNNLDLLFRRVQVDIRLRFRILFLVRDLGLLGEMFREPLLNDLHGGLAADPEPNL